ncbi:hypothetical protein Tco_0893155 [Tanacetum coccineum]|uniref:Uncharacterized protein n=1 Tax=Tanacetum coccineum TaxID=301880 RepID=A0ABQ5CB37_9ASTR
MSNTNMQTQTSNALQNAIMEAGGKDRPPMLAPGNYVQWKSRIKRYIDTNLTMNSSTIVSKIHHTSLNGLRRQFQLLKVVLKQLQKGIDNDIYSTVDAFPNACEMWKAIERFYKMMNELVRNQCDVTNNQVNVQFLFQLQPEWQRGKAIVNTSAPIYDQEHATITEDDEMSKEKEIDKLMALISLLFKKIYKPTNNNLRNLSNTSRTNQDNSPRINRGTRYENQRVVNVDGARENVGYHKEKMLLCKQEEAGVQLNAEQADWKDDTDDEFDD